MSRVGLERKRAKEREKYPTVALSDGVNAACCLWAAAKCIPISHEAAAGIFLIFIASAVGTLRFAVGGSELLAKANGVLADIGGQVGIPLLGLGYLLGW
eukprot:gene38289-27927_t